MKEINTQFKCPACQSWTEKENGKEIHPKHLFSTLIYEGIDAILVCKYCHKILDKENSVRKVLP